MVVEGQATLMGGSRCGIADELELRVGGFQLPGGNSSTNGNIP
jgi:hypothetical protein